MTDHPLHRANDDSAARLLFAEHAEERGNERMARAWRWMAEKAKWPESGWGWWPERYFDGTVCDRLPCHKLPIQFTGMTRLLWNAQEFRDCESALADALERGDL